MRRMTIIALTSLFLLNRSADPTPQFAQEAYVWQRSWTASVAAAVGRSKDFIRGWHVLATEMNALGVVNSARPDWHVLATTGARIVAVVRIDGRIDLARQPHVIDLALAAAGADPAIMGVEIDYDCPTQALPEYALMLKALRRQLPRRYGLSITSLPTWLQSADFAAVLDAVDSAVLQVHAVDDPRTGLFDRDKAFAWAEAMGQASAKPFLLALPAYGVSVGWDESGRLNSVIGEAPGFEGAETRELAAAPDTIVAFIRDIARDPPRNMIGLVWFRLPTDPDSRSWSFATWHAVIENALPRSEVTIRKLPAGEDGAYDLVMINEGTVDAVLPRAVPIDANCRFADGANGYALDQAGNGRWLRLTGERLIRAGAELRIGWERCGDEVAHAG